MPKHPLWYEIETEAALRERLGEEAWKELERRERMVCEICNDTGYYGENGPGIDVNDCYIQCECKKMKIRKPKYIHQESAIEAELREANQVLEAEVKRLREALETIAKDNWPDSWIIAKKALEDSDGS